MSNWSCLDVIVCMVVRTHVLHAPSIHAWLIWLMQCERNRWASSYVIINNDSMHRHLPTASKRTCAVVDPSQWKVEPLALVNLSHR